MTAARARAWASLDSAGLGFTLAIPSSHGCGTLGGTLNFGEHTVCSYGASTHGIRNYGPAGAGAAGD